MGTPLDCPDPCLCGVPVGLGRTDGLQDKCVCRCCLPVQAYYGSHNGITVANAELPVNVSTCGPKKMKPL